MEHWLTNYKLLITYIVNKRLCIFKEGLIFNITRVPKEQETLLGKKEEEEVNTPMYLSTLKRRFKNGATRK